MGEHSAESDAHRPLSVYNVDGMAFVKCSCDIDYRPQSAVWLREHWQGSQDEGIAALRAVVAGQSSDEPTCWRSECRNGCYYNRTCEPPPAKPAPDLAQRPADQTTETDC